MVAHIDDKLPTNKRATCILYILLFQKAIQVLIIEFSMEKFIFDHNSRILIFYR